MSVQVQLRRDTSANVAANKGAIGEVFIDTTNYRMRVQDGVTNGGWLPLGVSPAAVVEGADTSKVKHGGNISFACADELLSALSGATKVSTIAFPNPCLVLGCSVRVTTAITGATSFNVGRTGGTANEFGNVAIGLGTTNPGLLGTPNAQFSSVTVTLTAVGSNFTGGAVRIQLAYLLLNPPTS